MLKAGLHYGILGNLMSGAAVRTELDVIGHLAGQLKAPAIRELAGTLLQLADSLDHVWDGSNSQSIFRWPNELARIERNANALAIKARTIYQQRGKLRDYIPSDLLGEPAWDMLLDLFIQFAGGAKVSTSSLCLASRVPSTTALRHISSLEEAGMVVRSHSEFDRRVTFVSLTDQGVVAVGRYLEQY